MTAEILQYNKNPEQEPKPAEIVLITGGAGGIGKEIAKRFSLQGKKVLIGTRSFEKFESVKSEVEELGGAQPHPFIADVTNPAEILKAYKESGIKPGQTVDYFPLAAGGLDVASKDIGRVFVGLMRKLKTEGITIEAAEKATQEFREIMLRANVKEAAEQINLVAPIALGKLLENRGNINKNSKIVYLGSTISEYTKEVLERLGPDMDHQIDLMYPGPEYYRVVGIYKAKGIIRLQELAKHSGATFFNFVAPGVADTPIGNFFGRFVPVLKAIHKLTNEEELDFPSPPAAEIAEAIVNRVSQSQYTGQVTLYLGYNSGEVSSNKPSNFRTPMIDYL